MGSRSPVAPQDAPPGERLRGCDSRGKWLQTLAPDEFRAPASTVAVRSLSLGNWHRSSETWETNDWYDNVVVHPLDDNNHQ
jgi:hypothetical protein